MGLALVPIIGHAIAGVVWIGGMFFAYTALKPAEPDYDDSEKLKLWNGVYQIFVRWITCAIAVMWLSCIALIWMTDDLVNSVSIHTLGLLGLVLILTITTASLLFGPWNNLQRHIDAADFVSADQSVLAVRRFLLGNMLFGAAVMVFAFIPGLSSVPMI